MGKYNESLHDPELLNLRRDLALVEVRLVELLSGLDKSEKSSIADSAIWAGVGDQIEQRRKLVESEQKRLVQMQQVITSEQAMTFMAALTEAVKRHVTNPDQLSAIQTEFIRLTSRSDNRQSVE